MRFVTRALIAAMMFACPFVGDADEMPEIVIQMGHGDVVRCLDVNSPDYTLAASGSMDGTVKLWDMATGRLLRTLPGHKGGVLGVGFDRSGDIVVSGGADGVVRTWGVDTGDELLALSGPSGPVTSVAYAPLPSLSEERIFAASEDGRIWMWSPDGQPVNSFQAHESGATGILAGLPNAQIVTAGNDGAIRVWKLSDLTEPLVTMTGHDGPVTSLAYDPEFSRIASVGEDGFVRQWALGSGALLWETAGHTAPIQAVVLAGSALMTGGWDKAVRSWNAETGDLLGEQQSKDIIGAMLSYGKGFLTAEGDAVIHSTGPDHEQRLDGPGAWVYGVAVSEDGNYMATGHPDGLIRYWDIQNARLLRTIHTAGLAVTHGPAVSVALSADGSRIVSGEGDGSVRVWNAASGEPLHAFQKHEAWVYGVDLSPSETLVASGSADENIHIWNLESGEQLHTLEGHRGEVTSVAFSLDGNRLLSSSGDETLRIWDVASGESVGVLAGHEGWIFSACWTSDGNTIISGSEDGTVRVWDVAAGKVQATIDIGESVMSVHCGPDADRAWAGTLSGRVVQIDLKEGRVLASAADHTARVYSMAATADGATLLTASWDGTVKLRDPDGTERVAVIGLLDGDWLATTPDGTFASSIDGGRHVLWRIGRALYPFEQYEDVYRKPDLIRQRMKGSAESEPSAPPAPAAVGRPPSVAILSPDAAAVVPSEEIEITLRIVDDKGLSHVEVRLDGRPYQTFQSEDGENAGGVEAELALTIPLNYGDNKITVIAVDCDSLTSDPANITVTYDDPGPDSKGGDLWVVVVGVSEHSNPRYSLTYPSVDASAMAEMLQSKGQGVYENVKVHILNDKDSTTPNIMQTLESVSGQVGKQDVVMMFIAGHGVSLKTGEYYFITHDGDPLKLTQTAFSWEAFENLLRTMPARSVILFADTCHSGNIVKPDSRFVGTEELAENLVKESGVIVFVSSQGCEVSLESTAWGHGAFTYALLEALGGEANYQPDGVITMAELQLYVPTRVRRITKNKQHPRIPRLDNFDPEMPVVAVTP